MLKCGPNAEVVAALRIVLPMLDCVADAEQLLVVSTVPGFSIVKLPREVGYGSLGQFCQCVAVAELELAPLCANEIIVVDLLRQR